MSPSKELGYRRVYGRHWKRMDRARNPEKYALIYARRKSEGYFRRKQQEWRDKNPIKALALVKKFREQGRRRLNLLKLERPCYDCGLRFPPEVMDWDHRPGTVKCFQIGQGVSRTLSVVIDEIAKCDLVCANCHRLRTRSRRIGIDA